MKPYKLASWDKKGSYTHIKIDTGVEPLLIGEGYCTTIAGPCAVESEEGYLQIARFLWEAGAHALRGGLNPAPHRIPLRAWVGKAWK